MINVLEIEKAANDFIVSRTDRQGVVKTLRTLVSSCDRACANCGVPRTVKNRFNESVQIYLKGQISCLKSQ